MLERLPLFTRDELQKLPRHLLCRSVRVSSFKDVRLVRGCVVLQGHCARRNTWLSGIEFIDLAMQSAKFLAGGNVENASKIFDVRR